MSKRLLAKVDLERSCCWLLFAACCKSELELSGSSSLKTFPNFPEPLTHKLSARQTKDPQNPQQGLLSHLNKKRVGRYPLDFLFLKGLNIFQQNDKKSNLLTMLSMLKLGYYWFIFPLGTSSAELRIIVCASTNVFGSCVSLTNILSELGQKLKYDTGG